MDNENLYLTEQATLNLILDSKKAKIENKVAYTFLEKGEEETASITYGGLWEQSVNLAKALNDIGIKPGDRALLLFPSCIEYVVAFLGCLKAGVIAVPLFPPQSQKNSQSRMETVSIDCGAKAILTTSSTYKTMKDWLENSNVLGALPCLFPDNLPPVNPDSSWLEPDITPESTAFLQYTSGSTSAPKGVIVSHRNLVHNAELMRQAMNHTQNTVLVSWLPIFHDMGLIGNILQTLYLGAHCVFMPPIAFIQRPLRWLKALSKYRGQSSMAPNFAYDLCCEKITDEQKKELDLSSWQSALNGSEPVRYETLERFYRSFKSCGLDYKALYPGYGLAEATLMVSGPRVDDNYHHLSVSAVELADNNIIEKQTGEKGAVELVASGLPWCGTDVAIVNPISKTRCINNEVGEIWINSPSVGQGYWENEEATKETFHAKIADDTDQRNYMRTGDLGFINQGQIFITGRHKEIVVIRGQNYYPQDIERSVQNSNPAFVINGGASFAIDIAGEEKLVVVQEVKRTALKTLDVEAVIADAYKAVSKDHELQLYAICLIKPARLLKTSSGKIQRRAMKDRYLNGDLEFIAKHHFASTEGVSRYQEKFDFDAVTGKESSFIHAVMLEYLKGLIAALIQVPSSIVSARSKLVELGLDSMSFVNLQHLIESNFSLGESSANVEIDQNSTVEELVKEIHRVTQTDDSNNDSFQNEYNEYINEIKDGLHVSLNQESLWLVQGLYPDSYVYNIVAPLEIKNNLKLEKFQFALQELLNEEECFRYVYKQTASGLKAVHSSALPKIDVLDGAQLSASEIADAVDDFWKKPFSLDKEVPARFLIVRQQQSFLFVPVIHHIVSDMWSMLLFLERLAYAYFNDDRQLHLVESKQYPYSRFAFEQKRLLESSKLDREKNYWTEKLDGYTDLKLPTDYGSARTKSFAGEEESFSISNELSKKLKERARKQGVTPYVIALSAFNVLLHKISSQQDFVVGTATAGRGLSRYKEALGYFVNPLPLRTRIDVESSLVDYVAETQINVSEAMSHQALPFQKIVEMAKNNYDATVSPIFQVMFVYQSLPRLKQAYSLVLANRKVDFDLNGWEASSYPIEKKYAQFDITLTLVESDLGLEGRIEYNSDKFCPQRIELMVDQYQTVLNAFVAGQSSSIKSLSYLSGEEKADFDFASGSDLVGFLPVTAAISKHAEQSPNKMAVKAGDKFYSYSELETKVNQLSRWLLAQGFMAEDVVAVHMDRSCDYSVAMLAIMKAGMTYLPLDTHLPPQRLQFILQDSRPVLVLTDSTQSLVSETLLAQMSEESKVRVTKFDHINYQQYEVSSPDVTIDPEQLAYIIYTSGSTGTPKGVLCLHQGFKNCIEQCAETFGVSPEYKMLQSASYSFDASIWNSFICWHSGASLVVANKFQMLPGPDLIALLNKEMIDYCFLSPTVMAELNPTSVPNLKKVIAGGEELPAKVARNWFSHGKQVFNAYGPTEASICVTISKCDDEEWTTNIGKPIGNVFLTLLDENQQQVADGVEGEIYLGGISLARGYLNSPDKNRQAFIDYEYENGEFVRLYKTGDRAIRDFSGDLYYKGRKDGMVKIAGHRIELDEIRNVLVNTLDSVENAIVLVDEDQLVCFYLSSSGKIETSEIRQKLQLKLPAYMIPAELVSVDTIPRTDSGKADKKQLMVILEEHRNIRRSHSNDQQIKLDQTNLEKNIRNCWASVLGHENFGNDDLFFEVGGTSILMARLHHMLCENLGLDISMVDLYEYTTVTSLVSYANQGANASAETAINVGNKPVSSRAEKRKRARQKSENAEV
ncbi:non-ribosomal peptide synthetase [Teredinibacter sp. KSP-S5-2]|uniref:non-ribosomal peptide synthetase n=1 Tax=Teredinibacter sp. KSP-S5-2 TaxID=3034506 RepID=UPI00293466F8|nr:non-ribosomal peptide synthetase [Teredinibacter sp. KSP-S5-2]WNO11461.1 amino acid adenylation domain-containing protein [Teredinibacter sp. KSP-S5-2]